MYSKKYDLWPIQSTLKDAGVSAEVFDSLTVDMSVAALTDALSGLTTKAHKDAARDAIAHAKGSKARQVARSNDARGF